MATYTGIDAELRFGSEPTKVACCEKFSVKETVNVIGDNAIGEKWDKNIAGTHSFSVSGTFNLDYSDSNRKMVVDADGSEIAFEGIAGNLTLSGAFITDSWDISTDRNAKIVVAFTGKGTGELVKAETV